MLLVHHKPDDGSHQSGSDKWNLSQDFKLQTNYRGHIDERIQESVEKGRMVETL